MPLTADVLSREPRSITAAIPTPATRASDRAARRLEVLAARARPAAATHAALALAVSALLWGSVDGALLVGLLAASAALEGLRLLAARAPSPRLAPLAATALASAALWGTFAALVATRPGSAMATAALACAALPLAVSPMLVGQHRGVHAACTLAIAAPSALALLVFHGTSGALAALAVVALAAIATITATTIARGLRERLDLARERDELVGVIEHLHRRAEAVEAGGDGGEAAWRRALDAVSDAVVITAGDGAVRYMNPAAETLVGMPAHAAAGRPFTRVVHLAATHERDRILDPVAETIERGEPVHLGDDVQLLAARGRTSRYVAASAWPLGASAVRGGEAGARGALVTLRDVHETRGLNELMSFQSTHDPLTGLINRHELARRLQRMLASGAARHVLCYIDLAHLDMINDTCGHPAGDALLRQVAARFQTQVRGTDTLARLGGDQFALLLTDCGLDDAEQVGENLRDAVRSLRFPWEGHVFEVSASVGIAALDGSIAHYSDALSAAHAACIVARQQGGNRVRRHEPADLALVQHQDLTRWMQKVREAVEGSRFQLLVQTIAPLGEDADLAPHGELLVRMLDERGELVAPHTFLAAAERYNLMPAVDRWVLQEAFRALERGAPALERLRSCAVNLSGQSLSDPDLLDYVSHLLDATSVAAHRLCFEVTETALIENLDTARGFMLALKGRGCRFALDDFGSGMSSYSYLKHLPADYLKIDGSFVRGIVENPTDRAVVESIHQIARGLGMYTVAEYAESEAILAVLREIGVDYAQGSAVGEPRPVG